MLVERYPHTLTAFLSKLLSSRTSHFVTRMYIHVTYPEQLIRGWALGVVLSEALFCETREFGSPVRRQKRMIGSSWFVCCADHFLGALRRGGGLRGMRNNALIGCILQRAVWTREREKEREREREKEREREREREEREMITIWSSCFAVNSRGSPSAISMAVIPRDH